MNDNAGDNQNWNNTGEQIKGALTEAMQSGDFKKLNDLLSRTAVNALNEVGRYIIPNEGGQQRNSQADFSEVQEDEESDAGTDIPIWQQRARQREQQRQIKIQKDWEEQLRRRQEQLKEQQRQWQETKRQEQERLQKQHKSMDVSLVKFKQVGHVSSVLYQVFGGIGLGITGFVTAIRLLMAATGAGTTVKGWIVNALFLIVFFGMIRCGIGRNRRLKRAKRYVQLCDYRMYGQIEDLARDTGKSERFVLKDLQKMLNLGVFPEGHLDEQKTCFMLNDVVYRQYLELEKNRRFQEKENERISRQEEEKVSHGQSATGIPGEQETELNTMVAEGMECIRRLRDLNDKISEEAISAKLYRLENLLRDIFDSVREHPEQMHRMHKLMDYYLPTTLKLVEAYEEFARVSTPGQEIIEAKAEIEKTLDTINQAFTELLNNLFQDAVFDATTDAQVLKTMLAREGLMKEMEFVHR